MFSYLITRTRRKMLPCIYILVLSLTFSAILCMLHKANAQEVADYEWTSQNVPIALRVSNLTGLRTKDLDAPAWVETVFGVNESLWSLPNSLTDYVKDVESQATAPVNSAFVNGEPASFSNLIGITSPTQLEKNQDHTGSPITWLEGYDASCLTGQEAVCLIPEGSWDLSQGPLTIEVETVLESAGMQPVPVYAQTTFQVVGTYAGGGNDLLCPYYIMRLVYSKSDVPVVVDSLTAYLKDNSQLSQVQQVAANWFAEPNPTGTPTPWGKWEYVYYPYALIVDDSQHVNAKESMQTSLLINGICTVLVFALSAGISFFVGFLIIRTRKKEILRMRTMGTPTWSIFLGFATEQMLCVLLGAFLGGLPFLWQPMQQIFVFIGIYAIGLVISLLVFLRKNLLSTMKEEE